METEESEVKRLKPSTERVRRLREKRRKQSMCIDCACEIDTGAWRCEECQKVIKQYRRKL